MASLIVVSGKSKGCYLPLEECTTSVGRDEGCDAQILDEMVSRRHMEIRYWAPAACFQVVDLQSANGVFVNDSRINRPTLLRDGDVIMIGESRIVYTAGDLDDCEAADMMIRHRGQTGRSTIMPGSKWPFVSKKPAKSAWRKVPA